MRLSISNIAWDASTDINAFLLMRKNGFMGLEIAPTRIFPETPYDNVKQAQIWSDKLRAGFGFTIPSMQSIWYGRQEKIFASSAEREILTDYTKKAIDFASSIKCGNLVFGCPKNRNVPGEYCDEIAIRFFKEIGDYAASKGTTIGMEANPPIYNTNFLNDTVTAIEFIDRVKSDGLKLNLDIGTVIQNQEDISEIAGKVSIISHVHISEPGLKPIEARKLHEKLRDILEQESYRGFVSVEMGRVDDLSVLDSTMKYVKGIFE